MIYDDWTEEETRKVERYLIKEGINSELHCDAESWEGIMLERSESAIASKAKRILRQRAESLRQETMFGDADKRAIYDHILRLRIQGNSAEEVLEKVNVKWPKVKLSDVNEITMAMARIAYKQIAQQAGVEDPKELRDFRQFSRLIQVYGRGLNQFNKAKVVKALQNG